MPGSRKQCRRWGRSGPTCREGAVSCPIGREAARIGGGRDAPACRACTDRHHRRSGVRGPSPRGHRQDRHPRPLPFGSGPWGVSVGGRRLWLVRMQGVDRGSGCSTDAAPVMHRVEQLLASRHGLSHAALARAAQVSPSTLSAVLNDVAAGRNRRIQEAAAQRLLALGMPAAVPRHRGRRQDPCPDSRVTGYEAHAVPAATADNRETDCCFIVCGDRVLSWHRTPVA